MAFEKGQRFRLKRPFWGHKPGTKTRITQTQPPDPVNKYTARMKLRGSPPAYVRDTDVDNLIEPLPENMSDTLTEKKWMKGAINPKHKGYCTPMSKSTCTPRRKALAKRFKSGDLHNDESKAKQIVATLLEDGE